LIVALQADHWLRGGTPRELLINAAALIIAEIERLERFEASTPSAPAMVAANPAILEKQA
jgi:hypothetical protein